ncbi:MAG TPA: isoprenylcysteine carboxylmethyltransferase family protein [Candidatus Bathyarchaeia archaeon]|nr:isoprenylcysteine carboxylmethyltransferase family protein [Candidatus Bathyarchaeia archaeon]
MVPAIVLTLALPVAIGAVLFGAAGRWNIPAFWIYLALVLALNVLGLRLSDPDLVRERLHPGPGERDRLTRIVIAPILGLHWMIAGADVGWGRWSCFGLPVLRAAGFLGVAAGILVALWALRVNRFFSSAVRLQPERKQHLIDGGPYRVVRHPGYGGAIVASLASAVALGSWLSLIPIAVGIVIIVWRTLLEERMLRDGLEGYPDYMQRVRYRLVPGLW